MSGNITVVVKNSKDELDSFPISNPIILEFSKPVEDSYLHDYIYLIQAIDTTPLLTSQDLVKDNFSPIETSITKIKDTPFTVSIKPIKPLTPGLSYVLLVQKTLANEHLSVVKTKSMSNSIVELLSSTIDGSVSLTFVKDSYFVGGKHFIDISLNGARNTLDLTNAVHTINGYQIKFPSKVYVKDESFNLITSTTVDRLDVTYTVNIKAANDKTIKPISNPSTKLSLDDLDKPFQKPKEVSIDISNLSYEFDMTSYASFKVTFNQPIVPYLDMDEMSLSTREAFNMYTLADLGLYDPNKVYSITWDIISDNSVEFFVAER